jgi:phosphohistidine phosphatase
VDLILWRHAEAHEAKPGQSDHDRALTAKGERQAERMAGWLNRLLPSSTRVLASPSRRTLQTVAALERKFKAVEDLGPESGVEALLHACRWPDGREPVLVVGHQPTLGLAAAYLVTRQASAWVLRKGAVLWLRGRERDGEQQVVLHAAMSPELL